MLPTEPCGAVKTAKLKATIMPKATSRINALKSEQVEAESNLIVLIKSAKRLSDLPLPFNILKFIKQFCSTCYHGWMTSEDPFNGFTLESSHLLEIIRNAFGKTFPNTTYLLALRDIFHRTVSLTMCHCLYNY
jgi:hypothetical protein